MDGLHYAGLISSSVIGNVIEKREKILYFYN